MIAKSFCNGGEGEAGEKERACFSAYYIMFHSSVCRFFFFFSLHLI